jgi:predicted transcriptional regulator
MLVMAEPSTLTLSPELTEDLQAAADACDMTFEEFARRVLEREAHLAAEALGWNGPSIEEDLASLEEYERTGEAIPADEVFAWMRSLRTDNPLPKPQARKLR